MSRRYLLYLPVGEALFSPWIFHPNRKYDVAINFYSTQPDESFAHKAEYVFFTRGGKWPAIYKNLASIRRQYQSYAFFDEDVHLSVESLNRCFSAGDHLKIDLFQASLSQRSIGFHKELFYQEQSSKFFRPTNLVEIMMPIFSQKFLSEVAHTFPESESGYGLDYVWASKKPRMGVINAYQAEHLRSVRSVFWRNSRGESAHQEMVRILKKYDLPVQWKHQAYYFLRQNLIKFQQQRKSSLWAWLETPQAGMKIKKAQSKASTSSRLVHQAQSLS